MDPVTAAASFALDRDTAVTRTGEGRFDAVITDGWGALGAGPNGGYVLGICLRALAEVLPLPDPLVVSASFVRRSTPGPATVRTDVVRVGRRVATGRAVLEQDGEAIVAATATFADLGAAEGRTLELGTPPDLPPAEECVDVMEGLSLPGVTIAERYHYRMRGRPGWAVGAPSGTPSAELWVRFADERPIDALALPVVADGMAPVVMDLPGVVGSSTMDLTVHVRARPAPGWLACRVQTRHVRNGYHEEDLELWDATGVLVAQSRQLALLREV